MKNSNIFAADFETTVYRGQTKTEVWSSAFCPIRTKEMLDRSERKPDENDVLIFGSIDKSVEWLESLNRDVILYYHNLKFDGTFWMSWLMTHGYRWLEKEKKHDSNVPCTFSALISDLGQWYTLTVILKNGKSVEMRDSLKLLPFSLRKLAKDFNTPHQKLEMEYEGKRSANCKITDEEKSYICNDVLVLSELMEIMFSEGIDTLTIGSACMRNFKETVGKMYYNECFMDLTLMPLSDGVRHVYDKTEEGHDFGTTVKRIYDPLTDTKKVQRVSVSNVDQYIRKAYHGGWCYVKKDRAKKLYTTGNCPFYSEDGKKYIGTTADVNSLYPSMMSSESGSRYPIGMPHMVDGKTIQEIMKDDKKFCFIRIKCRFEIKPNRLPFIQIKGSIFYKGTEMLESSKPTHKGEKRDEWYFPRTGDKVTSTVELTLTRMDYELLHRQYNVMDEVVLDGCWFWTDIGMFDEYISHWKQIKQTSKGAKRAIAKLFLNNLYGKFSTSPLNVVKVPELTDDNIVVLDDDDRDDKKAGYIAIGAAITSYARNFTISAAQENYDTFCYADTDSIHCLTSVDKIKGIKVHPTAFCCWKLETNWDAAVFLRQKTYVERATHEDEKSVDTYYNVKCAGMPETCKNLFIKSIKQTSREAQHNRHMASMIKKMSPDMYADDDTWQEYDFLSKKRSLYDFKEGLTIPGKLKPVRIKGGIVLVPTPFTINQEKGI